MENSTFIIFYLHYGAKITSNNLNTFVKKRSFIVNTLFAKKDMSYCVDGIKFEYSFPYRGDSRSTSLILSDNECSMTDFF